MAKHKQKKEITAEIIAQRKYDLIKRCPIALELEKDHHKGIEIDRFYKKKLGKSYKRHYLYNIEKNSSYSSDELEHKFLKKWNINCYPTGKHEGKPFEWLEVRPSFSNVMSLSNYIYEQINPRLNRMRANEREHFDKEGWIFFPWDGGFDDRGYAYVPIPSKTIPILIDPGGLTEKSKGKVTEQVWDIVKDVILKQKADSKKWQPIPKAGDPPELGFIYVTGKDEFKKYLRWYDLHMGEDCATPKGYPFRTIAFLDFIDNFIKKNTKQLAKAKQEKEELIKITEFVRSTKGKASLRKSVRKAIETQLIGNIGQKIIAIFEDTFKLEDSVEKQVKTIYKSIHRKPYPSKKQKELIECPIHGALCNKQCKHYKEVKRIFDDRFKLRGIIPTEKSDTHDLKGPKPPVRGRSTKIKGMQEIQEQEGSKYSWNIKW